MPIVSLSFRVLLTCAGGVLVGIIGAACAFSLSMMMENLGALVPFHRILNQKESFISKHLTGRICLSQ